MRTFQKRAQTLVKATVQLQSYIGTRVSIIGDFNTTLALIDRSFKQKLNRNAGETGVTSQMDLAHVSKTFHPHTKKKKKIFFSQHFMKHSPRLTTYSRHYGSLNGYRKIEITPCLLSDHHRLKVDINNRKLTNS